MGIAWDMIQAVINPSWPVTGRWERAVISGPAWPGQNVMYTKSQFAAFASGTRQTVQSAIMQPVVAGLTDDDIEAVAHYFDSVQDKTGSKHIINRE